MEKVLDVGESEVSSNKRKAKVREKVARHRAKRKKLLAPTKSVLKCSNKVKILNQVRSNMGRHRANQTSRQKFNAPHANKLGIRERRKSMATRIRPKVGLKSIEILKGSFIVPLLTRF